MRALIYGDFFPKLLRDIRDRPDRWASRLVFLLGPWAGFWMVETLNENNIFQDLYPWQVLMNMVWYYLLFLAARLLLGRRRRAAAVSTLLCFAVGLLNHYILRFRGRILFPADIPGWRTAANVAGGFDFSPDLYINQAVILLTVYLFLVWVCSPQKKRDRLPAWASIPLVLAMVGYSFAFFETDMLPNLGIYTQQWVTQRNGFALNFTVAMRYSSVEQPDGYSRDAVLELMEEYPAIPADGSVTRPANIVVVMNESFADMTVFDALEPSEDPTPFLRSMEENTVKGLMYSPVTGGGTASVEFEYLTGFSTLFQPPHTVAYQLYVEENMPSLAALAGRAGYESSAFHPYKSSGWNRPIAYKYLGFDHQLYEEDVKQPYLIRSYISDQSDYQTVMDVTEREDSSFIFNVTMQNHSGYAQGWNNLERTVNLPLEQRTVDSASVQYLCLIKASDDALKELIHYYKQSDEPTLVVFFGDHQPPLKNDFYEMLYGKPLSERDTAEVLQQYAVPFFLWANYDIEERENVVVSPNYLGVLTAQVAGLPLTGFMSFLSEMYKELPAITPVGFVTADGDCLTRSELNETQTEWLRRYEILNYCGMVDLFDEARPMFCAED